MKYENSRTFKDFVGAVKTLLAAAYVKCYESISHYFQYCQHSLTAHKHTREHVKSSV